MFQQLLSSGCAERNGQKVKDALEIYDKETYHVFDMICYGNKNNLDFLKFLYSIIDQDIQTIIKKPDTFLIAIHGLIVNCIKTKKTVDEIKNSDIVNFGLDKKIVPFAYLIYQFSSDYRSLYNKKDFDNDNFIEILDHIVTTWIKTDPELKDLWYINLAIDNFIHSDCDEDILLKILKLLLSIPSFDLMRTDIHNVFLSRCTKFKMMKFLVAHATTKLDAYIDLEKWKLDLSSCVSMNEITNMKLGDLIRTQLHINYKKHYYKNIRMNIKQFDQFLQTLYTSDICVSDKIVFDECDD